MNSLLASGTLFDNEVLMRVLMPPLHPLIPECGWLMVFSVPNMLIFQNTCWCHFQSGKLWKFFFVFLICISALEFSLYFYFSTLILTWERGRTTERQGAVELSADANSGEDMPVCNTCAWGTWAWGSHAAGSSSSAPGVSSSGCDSTVRVCVKSGLPATYFTLHLFFKRLIF